MRARRFQAGHEEATQSRDCIKFGRTVTGWDMGERGQDARMGHQQGAVSGVEGWERSAPLHESRGLGVAGTGGIASW